MIENITDNLSKKFGSQINELWDSFGQDFTYPGHSPTYVEEYFEEETSPTKALNGELMTGSVQCLPLPGMPSIMQLSLATVNLYKVEAGSLNEKKKKRSQVVLDFKVS